MGPKDLPVDGETARERCVCHPHLRFLPHSSSFWPGPTFRERRSNFVQAGANSLLQSPHSPADPAPLYSLYHDPFTVGHKPIFFNSQFKPSACLPPGDYLRGPAGQACLSAAHTSPQQGHKQPARSHALDWKLWPACQGYGNYNFN